MSKIQFKTSLRDNCPEEDVGCHKYFIWLMCMSSSIWLFRLEEDRDIPETLFWETKTKHIKFVYQTDIH